MSHQKLWVKIDFTNKKISDRYLYEFNLNKNDLNQKN